MLKYIPFSPYAPDQTDYGSDTSRNVLNVYPQNVSPGPPMEVTYRPFQSFTEYRNALAGRCQGAFAMFTRSGNVAIFAGDQSRLYQLTVTSPNWVSVGNVTAYSVDPETFWYFTRWGDQILATQLADPIQIFRVGSSTHFTDLANGNVTALNVTAGRGYTDGTNYPLVATGGGGRGFIGFIDVVAGELANPRLIARGKDYTTAPIITFLAGSGSGGSIISVISDIAPRAKFIAVVRDFTVAGYTIDSVDEIQTQRVWWSAIGNPQGWPTPGRDGAVQVESDFQNIPGVHGDLVGIFPGVGTNDAVLMFNRAVFSMRYVGSPAVFEFTPLVGVKGSYAPKSIVQEGSFLYYYSEDGFRSFNGSQTQSIGLNKVDQKVRSELNSIYIDRVIGVSDPYTQRIIWMYPGPSSRNGIPDTMLVYKWALDVWSEVHPGSIEFLFRGSTFGFTLETLAALYPTLESIPASLDSPQWSSNIITLSAFNENHKMGYFSGQPLTPRIDTSMFMIGDGINIPADERAVITMTRPVFQGISTQATTQVGYRETLNQDFTFTNAVATNQIGLAPQRVRGRYFIGRVSTTNTVWDILTGIEMDVKPAGRR